MSESPVVDLEQGPVRGVWREIVQRPSSSGGFARSAAFLGIPFAEAPVGEHRFGTPVPASGWDGVRDATTFGPTPQRRPFGEVTAIPEPSFPGEATLNVNVFTPVPGQAHAMRPVLVWIHGGGYKAGSPSSPWYDGIAFNRDGVVTVSISYRLGFDGFGWIPDAPHNRGLLDQIEALRWVRRNIAAFGGDPDRVTIAGQSAGGGSVWALMISPPAAGLFAAAISHSGALSPQSAAVAEDNGRAMADLAGVEWTRAGLSQVDEEKIIDLQDRVGLADPPADLDVAVAGIFSTGGMQLAYSPYLDGQVLPATVEDSLAAGIAADLPLITGRRRARVHRRGADVRAAAGWGRPARRADCDALGSRGRRLPRGVRRTARRRGVRARPADHRPHLPGADGGLGRPPPRRADLAVRLPAGAPRHRAQRALRRAPVRLGLPGCTAGHQLLSSGPAPVARRCDARRLGRVRPRPPRAVDRHGLPRGWP